DLSLEDELDSITFEDNLPSMTGRTLQAEIEQDRLEANKAQDNDPLPKRLLEGAVRTGMMIMETPFQEVSAAVSSFGQALFDDDDDALLPEFWENYTQKAARSTGAMVLADIWQNGWDSVDMGTGFFVG